MGVDLAAFARVRTGDWQVARHCLQATGEQRAASALKNDILRGHVR